MNYIKDDWIDFKDKPKNEKEYTRLIILYVSEEQKVDLQKLKGALKCNTWNDFVRRIILLHSEPIKMVKPFNKDDLFQKQETSYACRNCAALGACNLDPEVCGDIE